MFRFLDAVERLGTSRPWRVVVGGEGPQRPAVEARIAASTKLSERVRFLGPVPESEKPSLLARSRVFALPSLSDTSSVTLLEAMSAGAACVVTNRGGLGEIARSSSTGLVVDPANMARMLEAIERLLDDTALAREVSERGRAWVIAHASAERMADEFVSDYRAVLPRTLRRADPGSRTPPPIAEPSDPRR